MSVLGQEKVAASHMFITLPRIMPDTPLFRAVPEVKAAMHHFTLGCLTASFFFWMFISILCTENKHNQLSIYLVSLKYSFLDIGLPFSGTVCFLKSSVHLICGLPLFHLYSQCLQCKIILFHQLPFCLKSMTGEFQFKYGCLFKNICVSCVCVSSTHPSLLFCSVSIYSPFYLSLTLSICLSVVSSLLYHQCFLL